jgi:signal peptidase I
MGPSMLPTFNTSGDILLLEHFSTSFGRIRVGKPAQTWLTVFLMYCFDTGEFQDVR